jgi:hypothetical protein
VSKSRPISFRGSLNVAARSRRGTAKARSPLRNHKRLRVDSGYIVCGQLTHTGPESYVSEDR